MHYRSGAGQQAAPTARSGTQTPWISDPSRLSAFLMTKSGDLDEVADNMEEKHFLFLRTEYPRLSGDKFDAMEGECVPGSREPYDGMKGDWKVMKAGVCVEYLRDNKGLTLPQKWNACRPRFEEVISPGEDLGLKALYVYVGSDISVEAKTE